MQNELRVLVVDDNEIDRRLMKSLLGQLMIKDVQVAEDGAIAEVKIERAMEMGTPFELLLVDWNMPKVNGPKLLKYVKAMRKERRPKIIIMTGSSERENVEEAKENGAFDFIVKPVTIAVLSEKIQKL